MMGGLIQALSFSMPPQNICAPCQHLQSLAQIQQAAIRITISRTPES